MSCVIYEEYKENLNKFITSLPETRINFLYREANTQEVFLKTKFRFLDDPVVGKWYIILSVLNQ